MKRVAIIITGKVQGVFYRKYAREEAERLELNGFAQNEPDGTVYIEAEGGEAAIDQFLAWCRKGSPHATVDRIIFHELPTTNQVGFNTY